MPDRIAVTAADLVRRFGMWQERALQQPIAVTHHGRDRLVLLSFDRYREIEIATPPALDAGADALLAALLDNIAEGFVALDDSMIVHQVNRVAEAYFGRSRRQLEGKTLAEVFPTLEGSVLIELVRRVVRSREALRLETDAFVFEGRRIDLRIFPLAQGVAIVFANLTEQTALKAAFAKAKAAALALEHHTEIASIFCEAGGRLAVVDARFSQWLRFDRTALLHCRLFDLVAPADRKIVVEHFERVVADQKPAALTAQFLAKDLNACALHVSLAPASEGVCLVATLAREAA